MRKRIMMTATAVAIATAAALAVPAAASAEGFGQMINDGCGASYGQLVSTARQAGHIDGSVGGARVWIESGLAEAHGCS